MDSCFDLVESRQHGVASYESIDQLGDWSSIHRLNADGDDSDLRRISNPNLYFANWPMSHAKRVTKDNPEYYVGNYGKTQTVQEENHDQTMFKIRANPICCSFLTWFGHDFSAGQFASVRSFSIAATSWYPGFSYRPLSRVLHVTLANWQRFGFEFDLRSSPSAFSRCTDDQSTSWLHHNLLHRADETLHYNITDHYVSANFAVSFTAVCLRLAFIFMLG